MIIGTGICGTSVAGRCAERVGAVGITARTPPNKPPMSDRVRVRKTPRRFCRGVGAAPQPYQRETPCPTRACHRRFRKGGVGSDSKTVLDRKPHAHCARVSGGFSKILKTRRGGRSESLRGVVLQPFVSGRRTSPGVFGGGIGTLEAQPSPPADRPSRGVRARTKLEVLLPAMSPSPGRQERPDDRVVVRDRRCWAGVLF